MPYIWAALLNAAPWFSNTPLPFKNWLILSIEIFCGWSKRKNWYFNAGSWAKRFVSIACLTSLKLASVHLPGTRCTCGLYCKPACIWATWFNVIPVWLYLINSLAKSVDLIHANLPLDNLP